MANYPHWKVYKEIHPEEHSLNDDVGKMLLLVEKDPGLTQEGLGVFDNFDRHCLLVSLIYDYGLVDCYYRLTEKGKKILAQLRNA